nr:immunoglobulin heavy chain junction region [Macaca mulatta]MOY30689.1 immunoglobulin heavy chain junction region [Macaca mulatta]
CAQVTSGTNLYW